jgi:exopolysaccharide biosynthesis polyprenyl glycosylphosphotransferase
MTESIERAIDEDARGAVDGSARDSDRDLKEPRAVDRVLAPRKIRRGWLVRRALLVADLIGLLAALIATELLFAGPSDRLVDGLGPWAAAAVLLGLFPAWVIAAKLYGLYDWDEERAAHSTADDVLRVFHLITVGVWCLWVTLWLVGLGHPQQKTLTVLWLFTLAAVIAMRAAARFLTRRHPAYIQNTLIVGAGEIGQLIARKILQHPEYRIKLIGFTDPDPRELRSDVGAIQIFEGIDDIVRIVRTMDIDRVVIAFSRERDTELLQLVRELRAYDVQIDVVPRLFDAVGPSSTVHRIEGMPLVSIAAVRITRSSRLLKRCVDVVVAAVLLVLTAPLLLLIAVLVRHDSPGPAFYRQTRLGMDRRPFTLLKFRTMHQGTDDAPHREYLSQIMSTDAVPTTDNLYKLDRSTEITRLGRPLRKTSLDELPQLLNVLRGDMSLVGPRPAIPYELELYEPHHLDRFAVPAGLTGLWQVEARAHSTFREALDLDVAYARGWSLGLDALLLLRTPAVMFRKRETG